MNEKENVIYFPEQEYKAFDKLAKRKGFENIDELATFAIIDFFAKQYGIRIKTEKQKAVHDKLVKLIHKEPEMKLEDLLANISKDEASRDIEVSFMIPEKLLKVLEDQQYFGYGKQDFFVLATQRGISCELTSMDYDRAKEIEEKHGFDPGLESFTKEGTLIYP